MRRKTIARHIGRFWRNESGATAIEYALIAAGIAAVLVGTIASLGTKVTTMWTSIKNAFG